MNPEDWAIWAAAIAAGWVLVAIACNRLLDNPRGDVSVGLAIRAMRLYASLVHRLRVEGRENIPRGRRAGPLIVIANHTAGVDPVLIQAPCAFEIRWMMAEEMQLSAAGALWEWTGVIPVSRTAPDTRAIRLALRHLHDGGVLGVFPEGGIERPAEHIMPFLPGVGLLVAKTRTPVLPVIVQGTPHRPTAWGSLYRMSRSRVRFLPIIHYEERHLTPDEITRDLRRLFIDETGWPGNGNGAHSRGNGAK